MKNYLSKTITIFIFVVVSYLMSNALPVFADPPANLQNTDFIDPKTDVSDWNIDYNLTGVRWNKEQLCIDYKPPDEFKWAPTTGTEPIRGNIWTVIPKSDGRWIATFVGPIRMEHNLGTICNQGDGQAGSDFLACVTKTPIEKGKLYGFFLSAPARPGWVKDEGRSDIKMAPWQRPSSTPGSESATDCNNIPSPPPPVPHNYSCVSVVGSTASYCSNDATGTYTTSSCTDDKGVSACPPAGLTTRYVCKNQACLVDLNGLFSSCEQACGTNTEAKPPIILKIQPTTAPIAAQIEVTGSDLGSMVNLLFPDGTTSKSFGGYLEDNSNTLVKFEVPDLPVGVYKVRAFGWGKYATEMTTNSIDLTIKAGGDDFAGSPTLGIPTGYKSLGELITFIFAWSLRLLGITVFVMIFYAGVIWMTAHGDTGQVGDAKKRMTNAVLGAILLLSAYLILYTINPNLVGGTFTLPGIGAPPTQTTP